MSDTQLTPATSSRWKRGAYAILVAAALATVVIIWFHTPTVVVVADSGSGDEDRTVRCANAGPSRWDPPTVYSGQELMNGSEPAFQAHNQQVMKNDIEWMGVQLVCGQARSSHTNSLIVTTFGAGVVLFFGYGALWARRDEAKLGASLDAYSR